MKTNKNATIHLLQVLSSCNANVILNVLTIGAWLSHFCKRCRPIFLGLSVWPQLVKVKLLKEYVEVNQTNTSKCFCTNQITGENVSN